VKVGGGEVDLIPAQVCQLRDAQAMPVGDQQHRGVAVTMAALLGGGDQALDLVSSQVFP
jgi:hypothetical protein